MLSYRHETLLGDLPDAWDKFVLRDVLVCHYPGDWGDESGPQMANVVRSTNLTDDSSLDLSDVARRALDSRKLGFLEPQRGDILLERSGGGPEQPVGRVGFVDRTMRGFAFSNFLHLLRPDNTKVHPRYLAWVLHYVNRSGRVLRLEQQTTQMRNLHFRDYLTIVLPKPSPPEQAAIADILDAVSKLVADTRVAAERARRLKRGVLQHLFSHGTRGHSRVPTELGHLPEDWSVIRGKQAFRTIGGYAPTALRFARPDEAADCWFMKVDDFNNPANSRAIVRTQRGLLLRDNAQVEPIPVGTVVIAKRGAAIDKNRVRTTRVPVVLDPNLMGLRMMQGIDPEFFRYQLEWRRLSRYVESSGVPQLNNKDLYPRPFIKAPRDEQLEIVEVVRAVERVEDGLLGEEVALERLRRGLMQELLTGRVRIPPAPHGKTVATWSAPAAGALRP